MESGEIIEKLKGIPLFAEIKGNDSLVQVLSAIFSERAYRKGDILFNEGDTGDELFIVASGEVIIQKRSRAGDTYAVAHLKAEDKVFFGELALVCNDTRSATVISATDSRFLVTDKSRFKQLGVEAPQIALSIMEMIVKTTADHLNKTGEDMLILYDALVTEINES